MTRPTQTPAGRGMTVPVSIWAPTDPAPPTSHAASVCVWKSPLRRSLPGITTLSSNIVESVGPLKPINLTKRQRLDPGELCDARRPPQEYPRQESNLRPTD